MPTALTLLLLAAIVYPALKLPARLRLSRAKHPSLQGHARLARLVAGLVPFYRYEGEAFFASDDAPAEIAERRRRGFERLAALLAERAPETNAAGAALADGVSDVAFTAAYRVPFQYRDYVREHLPAGSLVEASAGNRIRDLDGNWYWDLTGSYGVNVFGYDFYKECMERGAERVRELGPVLGPYHPVIADNVRRLQEISGMDEVSFHMSGTEAVMQAVRLARFHTGRRYLVRFSGAYHGWWDGVQPGVGSERRVDDVYTLAEMSDRTLAVLETRRDIACVLVNPLQAMHPNANAPGDGALVNSERKAAFDRSTYTEWLQQLRAVCSRRGIVLIFDEVFVGFRLARGGAQEYFDVAADIVTYGKTLGGGFPVGVVCGKRRYTRRYREDRPTRICFARGTFNSHPWVMAAMNEFLRRLEEPAIRDHYAGLDELWDGRAAALNRRLTDEDLPVRVANMVSIWTVTYTRPSRYNWMFQYYLRAEGIALPWIGTGRLIFSHTWSDEEFGEVAERFVAAARAMQADGWWWQAPGMTDKAIKKRILREMVAARLG